MESELSARLIDPSAKRPDRQVALLALSEQDIENIEALAIAEPRIKSHAVRIRRLIAREAKRIRSGQGVLDEDAA